jgi:hypothetical protein
MPAYDPFGCMMGDTNKDQRDELDALIARQLKGVRLSVSIPSADDDEPSDDELLAFVEGRLAPEAERLLLVQLQSHPFSADLAGILKRALADFGQEAVEFESTEASASSLARLVFALRRGAEEVLTFLRGTDSPIPLAPALVTVRGTPQAQREALYQFERQFGEWQATIVIENVPPRGTELHLELSRQGTPLRDGRATLRNRGHVVESIRVREGVADFVDLEPASYELEITRDEERIAQIALEILDA